MKQPLKTIGFTAELVFPHPSTMQLRAIGGAVVGRALIGTAMTADGEEPTAYTTKDAALDAAQRAAAIHGGRPTIRRIYA